MQRVPAFSIDELEIMLNSDNHEDRKSAARNIWTNWKNYTNTVELQKLEPILLQLLKEEGDDRSSWHYMISLGYMNSKGALELIVNKLQNSVTENIRGFAAEALNKYKN